MLNGENQSVQTAGNKGKKNRTVNERPSQMGIITKGKNAPQNNGDPLEMMSKMQGQMGNISSMVHHLVANSSIGSWSDHVFAGYLILKIPFPIPSNFSKMFQNGIQLNELNPSWMSSLSLYFIIAMGMRSFINNLLRKKAVHDADKTMQDQFQGSFNAIKQNEQGNFQFEWEQLLMAEHEDKMEDVGDFLVSEYPLPEDA